MIARRIFLRLTELGGETASGDTRRRATINELILKPEEKDATQAVLKVLADSRLVTTSENSVQVAHEALIREWPTLRGWLEDNREGLRLHRQMTEAAQDWQSAGGETDMLFRGVRLAQAREWADAHVDDMNPLEKEFLNASIAYSEREAEERVAQHQRELEATRQLAEAERRRAEEQSQATKKLQQRAIFLSLALAIAFVMVLIAFFLAKQATQNASLLVNENRIRTIAEARAEAEAELNYSLNLAATARALNISGQRDLALLLAMESVKVKQPPTEALTTLQTVAKGFGTRAILGWHSHSVQAVAIAPDSKTALSGSCVQLDNLERCLAGELILWDLDTLKERHRWSDPSDWITAVVYSLDGQTLISGSRDGSLLLWNMIGEQIGQLEGHTGSISDLVLVPGSGYLLSGSSDGSLILWDLNSKKAVRKFNKASSPITALAVAEANSTAVTAHQDGSLIMWDLENSTYLRRFEGSDVSIRSVAITPDASRVLFTVSTVSEMFLRMIDGYSGNKINEKHFACNPGDIVPSPDFTTVLMSCITSLVQIDSKNLNILENSFDPPDIINALAINREGTLGLSASHDRTIRVWNLGAPNKKQSTKFTVDELTAIAASPDGKYLLINDASKNGSDEPVLWDIEKREVVRTYPGFDGAVSPGAVAISPNGRYVAAAGSMNMRTPRVMIWDMESGELQCDLKGFTEVGRAVAFSPDSSYLLAGSQIPDGTIGHLILWDVKTCKKVRHFDTEEEVTSIQFSRDGSHALTGSSQLGRAILWDVTTGKEIKRFAYTYGPVMMVAFGPDDATVLGTGTGELYLWDVNTGNQIRKFVGSNYVPIVAAISPDGRYVLSGDLNGEVILWDFSTGEQLGRENLQNMVFSVAFSPDSKTAYAASVDGKLIQWSIVEQSLPELLEWIKENRYVRDLTNAEKLQYHLKP
jgi:WD40 repeat protein